MQAIILASGHGRRFAPITDQVPKPLLPVANWPLLDYLLTTVTQLDFSDVFVTVGYAADQVQRYLDTVALQHQVTPVAAPNWTQGPLASFQAVLPFLDVDLPCILLPGDLYISPRTLRLITTTSAEPALLYDPGKNRPGTLLKVGSANIVSQLVQSSVSLPNFFTALPVLRGSHRFFSEALTLPATPPRSVFELLQGWLAQGYPLRGVSIQNDIWWDVDAPADLVSLNNHLLTKGWPPTPRPPGTYVPSSTSMTGPLHNPSLTLGTDAVVEGPVLLGAGVSIEDGCVVGDGTSLGQATTVHANASLTRCLTLPHTHVPANLELHAAIMDAQGNVVR